MADSKTFTQAELPTAQPYPSNIEATSDGSVLKSGVFRSPKYVHDKSGWQMTSDGVIEAMSFYAAGESRINAPIIYSFTAGEAISQYDAVSLADGSSYLLDSSTTSTNSNVVDTTHWTSQKFTTSSAAITIASVIVGFTNATSTGTENLRVSIRANSAGAPTGADLGSADVSASISNSGTTEVTFTFSTPITVSPSTDYHIVIRESSAGTDPNTGVLRGNTGSTGANTSSDSGSSWSASNGKLYFKVYEINNVAGYLYRAKATTNNYLVKNFIGFARTAITSGAIGEVTISGVADKTGLSIGSQYYISDSAGALSTSAGTVSRKAGIALSTSKLLITNIW